MDRQKDKKMKKHKKEKKSKKNKKRDYRSSSSSSEEPIKKKLKKRQKYSTSESENNDSEWVEKKPSSPESKTARDEWLSLSSTLTTTTNESRRKQRELAKKEERDKEIYNPSCSTRELNPYWKDGGDGLPKFKKPNSDDEDNDDEKGKRNKYDKSARSSNWRKKSVESSVVKESNDVNEITKTKEVDAESDEDETPKKLSDAEMNALAAKIIKAEIMGDDDSVKRLKAMLERARGMSDGDDNEVVLTRTDSKGYTRPVRNVSDGGEGSSKGKKKKVETHSDGERVRYYADDDKYSLKQMFENEKFNSVEDQNDDFLKMCGKVRNEEDLDDIFTDKIRKKEPKGKTDKRNKDKAIGEHQRVTHTLDKCNKCFQSETMLKHLMLSMGETFYLCLPNHEPLTDGHCLLIPIRHAVCGTQLDENEWSELMDFRKALTRMFQSQDEDVIFFETANYLNRYPHMVIECIPLPKETGDLAPIYFKKAIDESETEWASNKKLISLTGKNVQRAVPKGLPYFSVSFGMDEGYAHVIEDQQMFPNNFAQEIIGGMLDLHHSKWRKPKPQTFDEQSKRVLDFSVRWNEFNFT